MRQRPCQSDTSLLTAGKADSAAADNSIYAIRHFRNFFVYAEHRNKGYGSAAYEQIERELKQQNGKYIDITPAKDAILFYLRKGFQKTTQKSLENGEIVYRKQI